jgi:hypothetical protein
METYEILAWCNQTLQGQFRKYPSVIGQVIGYCTGKETTSLEEAKEKFSQINYAVARILAGISSEDDDTDEVIEYAQKLNNYACIHGVLQIEKEWIRKRVLSVGKVVVVEDQHGQTKQGTVIEINKKLGQIAVELDDASTLAFSDNWKESAYRGYREENRHRGTEIPNYFVIKKVI